MWCKAAGDFINTRWYFVLHYHHMMISLQYVCQSVCSLVCLSFISEALGLTVVAQNPILSEVYFEHFLHIDTLTDWGGKGDWAFSIRALYALE